MQQIVVRPLRDADPESRELALVARLVWQQTMDPGSPLSTRLMAEKLGITEDECLKIVNSPTYREMVREEFERRIGDSLTRGVSVMDQILHDNSGKTSSKEKTNAFRALTGGMEALTKIAALKLNNGSKSVALKALQMLDMAMPGKRISRNAQANDTSVHISSGSDREGDVPLRQVAEAEDADEGRDRPA